MLSSDDAIPLGEHLMPTDSDSIEKALVRREGLIE